jgi:hypothetical protein
MLFQASSEDGMRQWVARISAAIQSYRETIKQTKIFE